MERKKSEFGRRGAKFRHCEMTRVVFIAGRIDKSVRRPSFLVLVFPARYCAARDEIIASSQGGTERRF